MRSHKLLRRTAHAAALGVGLMLPGLAQAELETFAGRFETASKNCLKTTSGRPSERCWRVQIDGRTASVLSVHFVGDGEEPGSIETLTFVVSLPDADTTVPLRCQLGRCALEAPSWAGRVNSVSVARYGNDGLAVSVPKAWLAKDGQCARADNTIRCSAVGPNGGQIRAEATL